MSIKKEHVHEFNRIALYEKSENGENFRREWRWKCQHPDCNAIWKRHQVKDKRSLCTVCKVNTLILDNDNLKRGKPRCIACSTTKEGKEHRKTKVAVSSFISKLLDIDRPVTPEELDENDQLSRMYMED